MLIVLSIYFFSYLSSRWRVCVGAQTANVFQILPDSHQLQHRVWNLHEQRGQTCCVGHWRQELRCQHLCRIYLWVNTCELLLLKYVSIYIYVLLLFVNIKSLSLCVSFTPDSQIKSVLTYAAEIWGLVKNNPLEQMHTFAIKHLKFFFCTLPPWLCVEKLIHIPCM